MQDSQYAFASILHCIMMLELEDRKRRTILDGYSAASILLEDFSQGTSLQDHHVLRLMDEAWLLWDMGAVQKSPAAAIILELSAMRINSPFDEMESMLGCDDQATTLQALDSLQQWRKSHTARRSVWHAGQIWRFARLRDDLRPVDFLVIAAWQATLCLWTYQGHSEGGILLEACVSSTNSGLAPQATQQVNYSGISSAPVHVDH